MSGVELTETERFVLIALLDHNEGIVSSRATGMDDRWFLVNGRVAESLHRKGLVLKGVERRIVRLSAAGRALTSPLQDSEGEK